MQAPSPPLEAEPSTRSQKPARSLKTGRLIGDGHKGLQWG